MFTSLSDSDIAAEFIKGNLVGEDAGALVRATRGWLAKVGLQHRDPFAVAEEAIRLSAVSRPHTQEPVEPPAQNVPDPLAAFTADVRSGISDLNAQAVRDMSMQDYAAARQHLIRRRSGDGVGLFG